MTIDVTIRPMEGGEETAVVGLVRRVFNEFVAPGYVPEGIEAFLSYVQAEQLARRVGANHFVLVARAGADLAGMIEVRDCDHISLLFVDKSYFRRGIARELWRRALALCRQRRPDLAEVSVNSSPYAVAIYAQLGFRPVAAEQTVNGIRFVPMVLRLEHEPPGAVR